MKVPLRTFSRSTALWLCTLTALAIVMFMATPAMAVQGAGFTTFDATAGGCLDSPNGIDCNNYTSKDKVYISGGPIAASLGVGCYYFAVLVPGFQNGGFVDGANGNLSDTTAGSTLGDAGTGDTAGNRTFSVDSTGAITYPATGCDSTSGAHATGTQPNTGKLIVQLIPYDDTANPGGVYVAAVCKVGAASPSDCKYDAFRIKVTTPGQPSQGTVTVCKFWDQNLDHIWDNNEPFMGAWPINATISGGDTAATLDTTSKDTDNTVGQDGTPGLGFGCATFTVTCRPATHPPRR